MQFDLEVVVVGSANVDLTVPVPRHPSGGETILGGELRHHLGGKGANQAVAAARAGGAHTALVAALGQDNFGDLLARSLQAAAVDILLVDRLDVPTGVAMISVAVDGENTIIVAPGANEQVGIDEPRARLIRKARVILAQLEIPLKTVQEAAAARSAESLFVLNAAPSQPLTDELWRLIDVLVVNEHEAADLSGGKESSPETLAVALLERVPTVVITLGSEGSLIAERGHALVRVPAYRVEAVDTTGAGDSYCGVLAAELAKGKSIVVAARVAAAAGALATTRAGAQESVPTASEVAELISRQHPG